MSHIPMGDATRDKPRGFVMHGRYAWPTSRPSHEGALPCRIGNPSSPTHDFRSSHNHMEGAAKPARPQLLCGKRGRESKQSPGCDVQAARRARCTGQL